MRAHPAFGDSLIAGSLALFDLGAMLSAGVYLPTSVLYLVGLLLVVPVIFRRKHPLASSYTILVGGVIQLFTHGSFDQGLPLRPADFALAVALYTMVAFVGRRRALVYALWLTIGTFVWAVWRVGPGAEAVFLVFLIAVIFGFSWALGEFVGARRAYQRELEQRLKLLETERDQQARIAVGEERSRIARELHDVVAHAVSVMVVQADGAGYAIKSNPDLAAAAMRTIADTGRQALTELRRLLGVLRSEDRSQTQWAPQPGAADLGALADNLRAAGLPVRLEAGDDLGALPAGLGLGIYRIVQEALTNTLKHAGSGASALVRVTRVEDHVELEVSDDGFGTPHDLVAVSGGNGLIGMRERAGVLGGTLEAGPNPGGGWRVRARLPLVPS
ncbi:sensor histidine kinase [Saccharothrix australiensis]|uniref:histidine kinase n=1 Tax=Saccharothrix australiensis TaxID=2072 RepID=A0A495VR17_9PSEU|nr:sensor histidine kinase [Saccharothrix australiensis]RKT51732.1 signal transduction histidine kinase [Saccharothrix australiensis]